MKEYCASLQGVLRPFEIRVNEEMKEYSPIQKVFLNSSISNSQFLRSIP